jgi:hypothetical protein
MAAAGVAGMLVIIYHIQLDERAGKFFGNFDTIYQVTRLHIPGQYNRKD